MKEVLSKLTGRKGAYERTFETKDGERVLAELYKFCMMNYNAHTQGDPYHTAHVLGMQKVGKHIQNILGQSDKEIQEYVSNNYINPK